MPITPAATEAATKARRRAKFARQLAEMSKNDPYLWMDLAADALRACGWSVTPNPITTPAAAKPNGTDEPRPANFRTRAGFTTTDGHRYTSIPTTVPYTWLPWFDSETGLQKYSSGDYLIVRHPYGARLTYSVHRDVDGKLTTVGIDNAASLRDAKERAQNNARGLDVFNWA